MFTRLSRPLLLAIATCVFALPAFAQRGPAQVLTDTVDVRAVQETVAVFAEVVAGQESAVAARVPGVVSEVLVQVGDLLEEGAPLARLDTQLLEIEKAQAEADLEIARAGLTVANAQLTAARQAFERASALRQRSAISEGQLEDREAAFAVARGALSQARAREQAAQVAISRVQYSLDNATIMAPFAGTVLSVATDPGEFISTGSEVARLLDTGTLEVQASVPARFIPALTAGMDVSGTSDAGADVSLMVRAILPTESSATRTRPVRFSGANGAAVAVGQSLTLDLPVSAPREALTVPKDALVQSPGGWTVYVHREGKAVPATVTIGTPMRDRFEVLTGLTAGDEVVVRGNERLRPMQDIAPTLVSSAPTN
ncbi:MAG: efflux RND transporter periplasmic adaptor subunit [Pseudomonadota bacterium]